MRDYDIMEPAVGVDGRALAYRVVDTGPVYTIHHPPLSDAEAPDAPHLRRAIPDEVVAAVAHPEVGK